MNVEKLNGFRLIYVSIFLLILLVTGIRSSFAATIEVGGTCSFADAISSANTNAAVNTCTAGDVLGTDVLLLMDQFTTLATVNNNTHGANGLPPITSSIKILINDSNGAYIDRDGSGPEFRFFYVAATGDLTLLNITLRYGAVTTGNTDLEKSGGAILNLGHLRLDSSRLSSNDAAIGGALYNGVTGVLVANDSDFSGNTATATGAGIFNAGSATFDLSEFNYNLATQDGGGIFNSGALFISNTTLVRNRSQGSGGAINQLNGSMDIRSSTISENQGDYRGGGLAIFDGTAALTNSTVSANKNGLQANALYISGGSIDITNSTFSAHLSSFPGESPIVNNGASLSFANSIIADTTGSACSGTITDLGNNWFQDDSCGRPGDGDPLLGPLSENGGPSTDNNGPTKTQALLAGSGAIDAGNDAICAVAPVDKLDQRGYTRPQGTHCDIGAYEVAVHTDTIVVDGINCTLVNAIHSANLNQPVMGCAAGTDGGTDTIVLQEDTLYELDTVDNGMIVSSGLNGLPEIISSIRIQGRGSEIARQAGAPMFRLFTVNFSGDLTLQDLRISNGLANDLYDESGRGGAIYNLGSLTLENCHLSGNWAYSGGAIYNELGSVALSHSTLNANIASVTEGEGGGLASEAGSVVLNSSTVSANSAYRGGGLHAFSGASLALYNSTISGNSAVYKGGGVSINTGSLELINTSLSDNSANDGGGLYADIQSLSLSNSLIANHLQGGDCRLYSVVTFNEPGPNWFEDTSCNNIASGDPKLGPLADNGGPTQTHALLAGSGALDAADDNLCSVLPIAGIDQRGEPRPLGLHCDIGAYESDGSGIAPVPEATGFFVLPLHNGKTVIFGL